MLMFDNTAALVPDLDTMEPVSPDVVREIEQGLPAYGCRPIRGGLSALSAHLPLSLYPVLNPGPGHVRACVRGGGGHGGFDALDQIGGLSLTDIASMAGVFAKPQPQSASPTYPANPRHPIVPASPISPPTEAINANNQGRAAAVSPEAGRTSGRASKGAGKKVLTVAKVKKLLAGAAQKITAKPASTKDDRVFNDFDILFFKPCWRWQCGRPSDWLWGWQPWDSRPWGLVARFAVGVAAGVSTQLLRIPMNYFKVVYHISSAHFPRAFLTHFKNVPWWTDSCLRSNGVPDLCMSSGRARRAPHRRRHCQDRHPPGTHRSARWGHRFAIVQFRASNRPAPRMIWSCPCRHVPALISYL